MSRFIVTISPLSIFTCTIAFALTNQDVQDYNESTEVGCISKTPVSINADVYFICKSLESTEIACDADHINVLFNVSPEMPSKNGVVGAQVEVNCGKKP